MDDLSVDCLDAWTAGETVTYSVGLSAFALADYLAANSVA